MAYFDSVLHTRLILAAAEDAGVSQETLLEAAKIPPALLDDPLAPVPMEQQFVLLEQAVTRTRDQAFGLRMARAWGRPGAMDAVGYRIATTSTFGEMIEVGYGMLARFSNVQRVTVEVADGTARIVCRPARTDWPIFRHLLEFFLASTVVQGRMVIAPNFAPIEARFPHAPPKDTTAHDRLFRCPLRFGEPEGELLLDGRWLTAPCPLADPELSEVLDHVTREGTSYEEGPTPLTERALAACRELLRAERATLEALALRLRMKKRTLQHRLTQEGSSYSQILDQARRTTALDLLRLTDQPIDEISFRLGYASSTSFLRACRRWTGLSPTQYRDAQTIKSS